MSYDNKESYKYKFVWNQNHLTAKSLFYYDIPFVT
jgi:hypothetical protein